MHFKAIVITLCFLLLFSCNEKPAEKKVETQESATKEKIVQQPAKNVVGAEKTLGEKTLAIVGDSKITQTDLDLAIKSLIGEEAAARMDDKATRKVLESMVMSRAISELRLAEISAEDQKLLDKEVDAYKERLLVRSYLAKHGTPQPVTMEMIEAYYNKHPELFGAKTIKEYEMVTAKRPLKQGERDEILSKLSDASTVEDWQQWGKELAATGYPMIYRQSKDDSDVLHPKLAQAVKTLSIGQASQLFFINETPYLVRIVDEKKIPAVPLSGVTAKIKKSLAPQQIKNAIEKAGKEALSKVEVEYK